MYQVYLDAIFGNLPWYVLGACAVMVLIAAGVVWAFVRWFSDR